MLTRTFSAETTSWCYALHLSLHCCIHGACASQFILPGAISLDFTWLLHGRSPLLLVGLVAGWRVLHVVARWNPGKARVAFGGPDLEALTPEPIEPTSLA